MSNIFSSPSPWMDDDIQMFDDSVARFLTQKFPEARIQAWREAGAVERAAWTEAGEAGLLGVSVQPEYGGPGGDFRHEAVLIRRLALSGADGVNIPMHSGVCVAYIQSYGTEEQKQRWLPKLVSGEYVAALGMTEPAAGSDLRGLRTTARRSGNGYLINGQKTFISNGQHCDLIILVVKTDADAGSKGLSLVVVETAKAPGFRRGRNLDKVGMDSADTSELYFDDVQVGGENLLGGEEGQGMYQMMKELPKERLIIAIDCLANLEAAVDVTLQYVKERKAFGQRILDFQNTQFKLAECKTEAVIARTFIDDCIERYMAGELDAVMASMAKYWVSEVAQKIIDTCLQFFGGYGYMNEYPIARLYRDIRVKRIYGGTTEIMKLLIARSLED